MLSMAVLGMPAPMDSHRHQQLPEQQERHSSRECEQLVRGRRCQTVLARQGVRLKVEEAQSAPTVSSRRQSVIDCKPIAYMFSDWEIGFSSSRAIWMKNIKTAHKQKIVRVWHSAQCTAVYSW